MSKKNHSPGPVPAGNRPHAGPGSVSTPDADADDNTTPPKDQEEDTKRRLGDFVGKGEHSLQEPGPRNDGGRAASEN